MKRSAKTSRAASLKGWRTRRKMKEARISEVGIAAYRGWMQRPRAVLDDMLPPEPTINRIPRPEIND